MVEFAWKCLAICGVCFAWLHLAIMWHELGHATLGWLAGIRPLTITVGKRPHLRIPLPGGRRLHWGVIPSHGMVDPDHRSLYRFSPSTWRRRLAPYLAGGLVFDAILLSITFHLARSLDTIWLAVPFFLHLVVAVGNAWPTVNKIEGRDLASDGASLLTTLKTDYVVLLGQAELWMSLVVSRYGATAPSDRLREPELLIRMSSIQSHQIARRYGEAIHEFRELASDESITALERSCFLDHMASIALDDPSGNLLVEALEWADTAIALNPSCLTLQASRASILVRLSRFQEARSIVEKVLAESHEQIDLVMGAVDMAEISASTDDTLEALRWLEKAREKAGSEFQLLERIHAASERIHVQLPPKPRPPT